MDQASDLIWWSWSSFVSRLAANCCSWYICYWYHRILHQMQWGSFWQPWSCRDNAWPCASNAQENVKMYLNLFQSLILTNAQRKLAFWHTSHISRAPVHRTPKAPRENSPYWKKAQCVHIVHFSSCLFLKSLDSQSLICAGLSMQIFLVFLKYNGIISYQEAASSFVDALTKSFCCVALPHRYRWSILGV